MKHQVRTITVLAGLVVLLSFYHTKSRECHLIDITTPNQQTVRAEVARTQIEQIRGLSFRKQLDPDAGMLFLFNQQGIYSFWMKDTFIPLEIIWMNNQKVVDIKQLATPSTNDIPRYTPQSEANAILEIPANQAKAYNIQIGSQLVWSDPCQTQSQP
jgi:uncharacterized membrane protein (UPF0127 family)